MDARVAIVGGGLAGLYAAWRLQAAGIDFLLVEARDRLGGRILSLGSDGQPSAGGFDLGPSWFWPAMQPRISALTEELGLVAFAQYSTGDVVFERFSNERPSRYAGYAQDPASLRLAGGTASLVQALKDRLQDKQLHLATAVKAIAIENGRIALSGEKSGGVPWHADVERVIFALPPRLLARIAITPRPSLQILQRWQSTSTWMAPHAKLVALYDRTFWRDNGLSGSAQSMVGPLAEIHDATTASGHAALFGFVGLGAGARSRMGEAQLMQAAVTQLARLFGPAAAQPMAVLYKDWTADAWTSTEDDQHSDGIHAMPDKTAWVDEEWQGRIMLAGSEAAQEHAGYLEGALDAADRAVAEIISN